MSRKQNQLEILIQELLQQPRESEWLEFKENNANPQTIGERISALANGAAIRSKPYGYLVFGVNDERELVGTTFNPHKTKKGNEELESWLLQRLRPRLDIRIYTLEIHQKKIAIFEIPSAPGQPVRFTHEAYIRVGSTTRKLRDYPEKEKLIWTMVDNEVFGKGIALERLSLDEVLTLLDHDAYFRLTELPNPFDKAKILAKFIEEGFITKSLDYFNITNLGAILFATNLNHFERLSRKAVRVIQYQGKTKLQTIKEQVGQKGYAVGFSGLIAYINHQLPTNEIIGQALRTNVKMFPEIGIRELVANAIIHQDFSISGTGPMVEIFSDRIEITNPGTPIIDTLRFIDHSPISRNEKLAAFMRRINICEERGSGIDKVVHSCEVFQLPAPNFIAESMFTKTVLFAHQRLRDMSKDDKIRACYQHCCLKYVSNDLMTNSSLRERFKVEKQNYATVSRIIADTIDVGLIKAFDPRSTSKKYAKYIPFWA